MKNALKIFLSCLLGTVILFAVAGCKTGQSTAYYTVTFISGGGSTVPAQRIEEGKKVTEPEDPERKGYSFEGWYNEDFTEEYDFNLPVTKNLTLYALWKSTGTEEPDPTEYTVTFTGGKDATGTAPTVSDKKAGESFKLPANTFTKTGYIFDGWSDGTDTYKAGDSYTMPDKSVIFTAQWVKDPSSEPEQPIKFTVTFTGGTGATGNAPTMSDKKAGESFALPANTFTNEGYTFKGWSDGFNNYQAGETYIMPEKSVIFTAQWEKNSSVTPVPETYSVTFKGGDGATGTAPTIQDKKAGESFTLPANTFTNEGYTFDGWSDGVNTYKEGATYVMPEKSVIFTAQWAKIPSTDPDNPPVEPDINYYTVSFNTHTDIKLSSQYVKENECACEPLAPEKDGYTFDGWYTDETYETVYDFSSPVTADITLHAKWTEAEIYYTVTFVTNCESKLPSQYVRSNGCAVLPLAPENAGFALEGWYTDKDLTVKYNFSEPLKSDVTLYANWVVAAKTVYVSFDTDGGTKIWTQAINSGMCAIEPDAPVKENFVFDGWYTDKAFTKSYDFSTPVLNDTTLFAKWTETKAPVVHILDFTDSSLSLYNSTNKCPGGIKFDIFELGAGIYVEGNTAGLKLEHGNLNTQTKSEAVTFTISENATGTLSLKIRNASTTATAVFNLYVKGETDALVYTCDCKSEVVEITLDNLQAGTYYFGTSGASARIGDITLTEYFN